MNQLLLTTFSTIISIWLILLYIKKRYCFLKPSIIFISFFNVFLQWPAVIYFSTINSLLSSALFDFVFIFSIIPLIVLALSSNLFLRSARMIYRFIDAPAFASIELKFVLFFGALIGSIIYFYYVPISNTGLVSILWQDDAISNALARESSLKLLPAFIRYLHVFSTKVFCTLLVLTTINELSIYRGYYLQDRKFFLQNLFALLKTLFLLIFAIVFSGISGARGMGAEVILTIFFFLFFKNKMRIKFKTVVILVICILSIPITLQYLRSGSQSWVGAINNIFERIFLGRLSAGIYTIHSSEVYGYWGIGAIPRISAIFGVESINVANVVAKMMYPGSPIKTAFLNSSFVMTYYAYFGWFSIFLNPALILFLDIIPWIVIKLIKPQLYCFVAVGYAIAMYKLTSIDYTTIFLSSGFVFLLITLMITPITFFIEKESTS